MSDVACPECGWMGAGTPGSPCPRPNCVATLIGIGETYAVGDEAMPAQIEIVKYQIKMFTIRTLASYCVAAIFAIIGAMFILFVPTERAIAANILAATFMIFAMGIAGYARFGVKAPGIDIAASTDGDRRSSLRRVSRPN